MQDVLVNDRFTDLLGDSRGSHAHPATPADEPALGEPGFLAAAPIRDSQTERNCDDGEDLGCWLNYHRTPTPEEARDIPHQHVVLAAYFTIDGQLILVAQYDCRGDTWTPSPWRLLHQGTDVRGLRRAIDDVTEKLAAGGYPVHRTGGREQRKAEENATVAGLTKTLSAIAGRRKRAQSLGLTI